MRAFMAILAAALLAQDPPPPAAKEPAFKMLCEPAKFLDRGIASFLAEKPPSEGFKPWEVAEMTETLLKELRDECKKREVKSARAFALELDLEFMSEAKPVYCVAALLLPGPTETQILGLKGYRLEPPGKNGMPFEKCVKESAPFGEAGAELLKLLKANKPADLPFAEMEATTKLAPTRFKGQVANLIAKSKTDAADVCKAVAELKYDQVRVQLDDLMWSPMGADGEVRDGLIGAKLTIKESGAVGIRLKSYQVR